MTSGRVVRFVRRAEHLAWRARWQKGRWVIRSPSPALRAAILRQDEEYRQADARWELNHGPVPGGARILVFHNTFCANSANPEDTHGSTENVTAL
jgi:hypothetical protein